MIALLSAFRSIAPLPAFPLIALLARFPSPVPALIGNASPSTELHDQRRKTGLSVLLAFVASLVVSFAQLASLPPTYTEEYNAMAAEVTRWLGR
ncbi:hypothetical protein AB0B45_37235 [Nonomuraea sp. NPDC049152]|uniref:hypothetical protein n=1 Tax=Nonomuraea sp. NPDC049152 TaxID=3154350 RepID=UPI0033D3BF6F